MEWIKSVAITVIGIVIFGLISWALMSGIDWIRWNLGTNVLLIVATAMMILGITIVVHEVRAGKI